jgi:hypothetical protein
MSDLSVTTPPDGVAEPPLAFHALTFHEEGDEVTVGRLDAGEFVVLPAEGANLLRKLVDGDSPASAAAWFEQTYGEPVDVADFVADLRELGFVRAEGEDAPAEPARVRWVRLGRAVFSPVSGVAVVALLVAWVVAMVREPVLAPSYHNLFYTHYLSVLMVTVFVAQLPLVLMHEAAHALAGRRLGLPSTLSIGRRLYYLVFQTTMDGLVAVPRRKRYLPILAGMLTDVVVMAAMTLIAAATQRADGSLPVAGAFLLAMAYLTLLRLLWQCWVFLQTDIYYLVVTVLGCVDLQTTTRQLLGNRFRKLVGKPAKHDPAAWHPRDHAAARWYSVLMVVGYALSIATLVLGVVPALGHVLTTVIDRFAGNGAQGSAGLLDNIVFLLLSVGELAVALVLFLRERRQAASTPTADPSLL